MDNLEKIMKKLSSMQRSEREQLLQTLQASMSDAQQEKLKSILQSKQGKKQLERELNSAELQDMISRMNSKQDLECALSSDDFKRRLRDILG